MDTKFSKNIMDSSNENYDTSTNTNIEKKGEENTSKWSSSKISSLFFCFNDYEENDEVILDLKKKSIREKLCNCNRIYLKKMTWLRNIIHTFIKLFFICDKCNNQFFIYMEKTDGGKEIEYNKNEDSEKWQYSTDYIPKSKITYDNCIRIFDKASGNWTLIANNCTHFSKFIWNNIKKLDEVKILMD